MAVCGRGRYGSIVLLGGDAEFRSMLDAISRAVDGRGYAVCVEGEPGIGKTALVDDVVTAAMAAHPTIQVVRAVGLESELSLPHAGLLDLLTPLLDRVDALPAAQRQNHCPGATPATAFQTMGLDLWAGRANDELAATGSTARRGPQRDVALTSQETRLPCTSPGV